MSKPCFAHFREYRASDLEAVLSLIHHTIDVSYSPVYPVRAIQFFKDFHSEAKILERHQNGEILILEKDGKVIGIGSLRTPNNTWQKLDIQNKSDIILNR